MTTTAPLRPFFGFYGGKWRDSPRHYPPPAHTRIIEPFAGSAGYSIRNPHLEVIPVDPGPATWFIDPPYRDAGKHYHHGAADIDYHHLAEWCTTRPGQVIVCEAASADWLPFESLGGIKTTRATVRSAEAVWIRP